MIISWANDDHHDLTECSILFQRERGVWRNLPDQCCCHLHWILHLHPSGHFQIDMFDRHHLVPLWRSRLWDEVWELDLQRVQGNNSCSKISPGEGQAFNIFLQFSTLAESDKNYLNACPWFQKSYYHNIMVMAARAQKVSAHWFVFEIFPERVSRGHFLSNSGHICWSTKRNWMAVGWIQLKHSSMNFNFPNLDLYNYVPVGFPTERGGWWHWDLCYERGVGPPR